MITLVDLRGAGVGLWNGTGVVTSVALVTACLGSGDASDTEGNSGASVGVCSVLTGSTGDGTCGTSTSISIEGMGCAALMSVCLFLLSTAAPDLRVGLHDDAR